MWMNCWRHWDFMNISGSFRTSFREVSSRELLIGRAIVKNPDILLCDEPTGALDYNTSKEILKLIETVNHKYGNTIVMVTHNDAIKDMADRVVKLRDGMIRRNYQNEQKIPAADLEW
jgi:putative ABC transport system ATP-binding protein